VPIAVARHDHDVVAVSRHAPDPGLLAGASWRALDLSDGDAVDRLFADVRPSAVISSAASNPGSDSDFGVNEVGAATIAEAAVRVGARLVHVSSDMVHGGGTSRGNPDAPYADDADPSPINEYGRSKAAGERAVLAIDPMAAVVRTSLIYGTARMDRGTSGFVERLRRGERLTLWGDAIRQPVWIDSLATGLLDLATRMVGVAGTLNLAGNEPISRAEFGRRLLAFWGIDAQDRIDVVSAVAIPGQPLDLRLELARATALGLDTPGVGDVLGR
jgi:dTDP-4-dehydrorhamnose reductase